MDKETKNTFHSKCLIVILISYSIISIINFARLDIKINSIKNNYETKIAAEDTTNKTEETINETREDQTTQDQTLKPCPFCGSNAKIFCSQYLTATAWVECEHCEASGSRYTNRENDLEDAQKQAILLWNNRIQN